MLGKKKEYNYFECFCEVGKIANEAASYLNQVMECFEVARIPEHVENMHKLENAADMIKHELTSHLAHEFITPIEREDISALSAELDNVVDTVEDVMRRIYMFNVKSLRPEAVEFTSLIARSCATFSKLLAEFPNFKKSKTINELIIEINTLENKGDKLHADSLRKLFGEPASADERLVWMMIFESLENSLDACENAADLIESIIMKNT
jgi:uncharacterized protein Yka (UPF0111/DUF47 family)